DKIMDAGIEKEILELIPDNHIVTGLKALWAVERSEEHIAFLKKARSGGGSCLPENNSFFSGHPTHAGWKLVAEAYKRQIPDREEIKDNIRKTIDYCMGRIAEEGLTAQNEELRNRTLVNNTVELRQKLVTEGTNQLMDVDFGPEVPIHNCTCSNDQIFGAGCICGGK